MAIDRLAVIKQLRAAGVECYTRAEWGSPRERDGSYAHRRSTHRMPAGPASYHFLHITVTPRPTGEAESKAEARRVESYGLSTPAMVSYQDLVTNEGRYLQGQDYGTKGTHTINDKRVPGFPMDLNLEGYATALLQNVDDEVTDDQVRVVAMVFAARELAGLVRRGAPIYPHRTFDWKECPGDKAVARLQEISRLRTHYVKTGLQEDDMFEDSDRALLKKAATGVDRLLARHAKLGKRITTLREKIARGNATGQELLADVDELQELLEAELEQDLGDELEGDRP